MIGLKKLPDNIKQDLSIYLAPDEKILKSISIASGKFETTGQIWLVLTDKSILFHTRKNQKEPVVALLARNNIEEIDYFQKQSEIVLTFYPQNNRANASRLAFPISSKSELEDFCEDLADLINFRLESKNGVKIYPKTGESKKQTQAVKPVETTKSVKPVKSSKPTETAPKTAKPEKVAGVKIFTSSDKPEDKGYEPDRTGIFSIKPGFIIASTVISIIVAFIWFKFFHLLARKD
ncbi:MAG: hypothetical protein ACQETH_05140 [Candidatus Rifleibacteriota bacterium]